MVNRRTITVATAALALSALFGLTPHGAQAQALDLLAPAAGADTGHTLTPAKRTRLVRLDLNALARSVAPQGADLAADRAERAARLPGVIRLALFPGVVGTFRRTSVEAGYGGGYMWGGDAVGASGSAALVVSGDHVTGRVELGSHVYRIEQVGGSVHRVIELDGARFPAEAPPKVVDTGKPDPIAPGDVNPAATTNTVIDVLYAYTSKAAAETTNILDDIKLSVTLANQGYAHSKVALQVHLKSAILVTNYDEDSFSFNDTLCHLTGLNRASYGCGSVTQEPINRFRPTRTRRNAVGADLVVLYRDSSGPTALYCGLGWLPTRPSSGTAFLGFAEVTRSCITNLSAHHEMGHNEGLDHDRYVASPTPNTFNYGFVNVPQHIRSIMAYDNQCQDASTSCTRLNYFSNPRITIQGSPFGFTKTTANAADNSLRLTQTKDAVAAYR